MATRNLRSPTGGIVSVIHKQPGDTVAEGDEIIFIECMKMEIPVVVEHAGRLAAVNVRPGDSVTEDQVLAVIEA
jgi:biotin carboxyl carrier protein